MTTMAILKNCDSWFKRVVMVSPLLRLPYLICKLVLDSTYLYFLFENQDDNYEQHISVLGIALLLHVLLSYLYPL